MNNTHPTLLLIHPPTAESRLPLLHSLLDIIDLPGLITIACPDADWIGERLSSLSPDLAVLLCPPDPRQSIEIISHLRESDSELQIIAISETEDRDVVWRIIESGAEDCLLLSELSTRVLTNTLQLALNRRRAEAKEGRLPRYDPLTGLLSQAALIDLVQRLLARHQLQPDFRFAILALDIADFYSIRQHRGRLTADRMLAALAHRLQDSARPSDFIGRLPDAEFVLVLPEVRNSGEAQAIRRRLESHVETPIFIQQSRLSVTPRWGITLSDQDFDGAYDMLGAAVLESKCF